MPCLLMDRIQNSLTIIILVHIQVNFTDVCMFYAYINLSLFPMIKFYKCIHNISRTIPHLSLLAKEKYENRSVKH